MRFAFDASRRGLGRAPLSLVAGAIMLLALIAANVVAFTVPEERSRELLIHEPPHFAILRPLLSTSVARDAVFRLSAPRGDTTSVAVFLSVPTPIARVGRSYEYRPRTREPLSEFELRGQPAGLTIDANTGVLSGTPTGLGLYKVEIDARIDDATTVRQSFDLFVDDRFLALGADHRGRDLVRRLVGTARFTIVPGLVAVLVSVAGGLLLGAFGGFYGGMSRQVLRGLTTVLESIPGLLIVFLAGVLSGFNLYVVMATVGLILLPEVANSVSQRVESLRKRDFVEAARELGLGDRTILWNEIVWHNCRSAVLARLMQGFTYAILIEITLSYMGLTQTESSLGRMLVAGRDDWPTSRAQGVAALTMLVMLVATFSLLERGVRGLWERA